MTPIRILTAAAVSALIAAPAFAQDPEMKPEDAVNPPVTAPATAEEAGTPASATTIDPATGAVVVRQDSPTPADEAYALKAGDPNVVTNGPVPDTPENRALYGGPMSRGGQMTAPRGN